MKDRRVLRKRGNSLEQTQLNPVSSVEEKSPLTPETLACIQKFSTRLAALAQKAASLTGAKACCIYMMEPLQQVLIPCAVWPANGGNTRFSRQAVGQGIAGLAARNWSEPGVTVPMPLRFNKSQVGAVPGLSGLEGKPQSALALPLVAPGQAELVGLLLVVDKAGASEFSAQDEQTLINFSEQADLGVILENTILTQEKERAALALQKRAEELIGLQRVSGELNSTLALDKVLSTVLGEAIRVTRADGGSIHMYDIQTGRLVIHTRQGELTSAGVDGLDRVLHGGKPVLLAAGAPRQPGAGSRVMIPIHYSGAPAGIINLESEQDNLFEDQLHYLEILSNQAAVAIGNARVYQEQKLEREQASRRADQLARLSEISNAFRTNRPLLEVLEDTAYAIVDSVGYDVVLLSLVKDSPPRLYHEVGAGIPVAQFQQLRQSGAALPLTQLQAVMTDEFRLSHSYFIPAESKAVWQGRLSIPYLENDRPFGTIEPVQSKDAWQTGDLLFTPLTDTDGDIIGLLTVENPANGRRPDLAALNTLEIFANQAAIAIESARLFDLEQQRRRLADTLRGVAEAISSQLEFDELLNVVLQALRKVVDYDSASVQLLQEDRLVIIGGQGWEDSQQILGLSFPMVGDNPNRLVVETQEPVIVRNAQVEYPTSFAGLHNRVRSWLGVPLTYGTNVLGLMAVDSFHLNHFTHEDAEVVLAFANQVAVALQNAHLFDEARQQVRQLAALTEVAQALNRALDLNEVLNLVLDAVFDLAGHSKGSIWLIDPGSSTVKIANTKNVSDLLVELFNESAISVTSEPFASVIKSGQVQVVASKITGKIDAPGGFVPFPDDVTYVPLKTENRVIGILAIENVIHKKSMLQLVTTLADLAAVAIDSARLLEDTRRQAREMQHLYNLGVEVSGMLEVQQVMNSVISNAITLTETQVGVILLWDEETQRYVVEGTTSTEDRTASQLTEHLAGLVKLEEGGGTPGDFWYEFAGQILRTGQPLIVLPPAQAGLLSPPRHLVADMAKVLLAVNQVVHPLPVNLSAVLGVPVRMQHQTSGAMFVGSTAARPFTWHDVQLLSFVANQAAVAVRNAQLVQRLNLFNEELERRVIQRTEELAQTLQDLTEERDRVGTLYQITRELAASFDLDRMLSEALSLLNRAVGISQGAILLLDHDSGSLLYRAALGRDMSLPRGGYKTRYRLGVGLAGRVMETRQPRLVPDLLLDADWVKSDDDPNHRSCLIVPLIAGEEVLGALLLFHPDVDYFNEDHLKLVTAAGAQVATAINNAELYRLITDQAERLGVMLRTQAAEAARSEAILKGITDGVLVLDARRNIVLVNPKAAEILSINPKTVENQPVRRILGTTRSPVESDLVQIFYNRLLAALVSIEAGERSAEFRVEAGSKVITISLAPVALGAEDLPSVVAVLRDISKEAEIERIKNEFISTVSHELRTPMTSIKGYADLLVSASPQVGSLNSTQQRFVQVIQSNANRLTDLVNDILEISRIETGRVKLDFESLEIDQVIREVAMSFEGQMVKKPMNLTLDLPGYLPRVHADRARLTQILVNLIGNAWQYTPEGGTITVRTEILKNKFIQVDVEDTGIGIPEKDIDYIFERFFRSERPEVQVVDGTGLGLSITKMFVEMLGGKIWVKSQIDVGTIFSFTVPLEAEVVPLKETPLDTVILLDRPYVLVIDKDPALAQLLKLPLEEKGYEVIAADQEYDALKVARGACQVLKVIVLDILLKDGAGFALLQQLKEDETVADIPILLAAFNEVEAGQALLPVVIDYIATCFEEAQILERVERALGKVKNGGPEVDNPKDTFYYKSSSPERVLVVDNNPETVKWLKDALEASGYKVQRAFNSQQALDIATSIRPDLILMNIKMPEVEGKKLIAQFYHLPDTHTIPVILITDNLVPPSGSNKIKMLGESYSTSRARELSIEAVVSEVLQISGEIDLAGSRSTETTG